MIPLYAKSGLVALCGFFLLTCRTGQLAYFQSTPTHVSAVEQALEPSPIATVDSLPLADRVATTAAPSHTLPPAAAAQVRHANPDAQPTRRRTWLHQSVMFAPAGDTYTAPRLPSTFTTKRAVPKGAVYALAASVLPYGLLLFRSLPNWAWLASLALPVASLFMATGALAKIRRNRGQYRGKGWAIAALLLATGYMGMVLYAVAALATSGILWE
ncbi:hypothetical protein ACAW74_00770 [Fibrella sp. WM1]|uniref:hypothetical protein n=1 Tax=Fibrella musci TaxID=3242485 RepID=UPI0035221481